MSELEEKGIGQIETWAVVEVMGHNKYAGFARSVSIGMGAMIRVDVPEIPERVIQVNEYSYEKQEYVNKPKTLPAMPAFTKFLGVNSIFAITPCSEELARKAVESFRSVPMTVVDIPQPKLLVEPRDEE